MERPSRQVEYGVRVSTVALQQYIPYWCTDPDSRGEAWFRTEPEAQDAPTSLHASVDVGVAAANTPTSDGDAGA